jgi:hypothetical protein
MEGRMKFVVGEQLIYKRPDGKEEECQMLMKGAVPGCIVVQFFDKNGKPTTHDGLTVPIKLLRSDDRYGG